MDMFIEHDADTRIEQLKKELDKLNNYTQSTFGKKASG